MNRKSMSVRHRQVEFKASEVKDDGSFTGYLSVFGTVDSYREIVAPGAFSKSIERIKASGEPLPVLWQHQSDVPIGGYDLLEEDEYGLRTSGRLLIDEIPQAAQAYALMKRRIVKGQSIGYFVEKSQYDEKTNIRTLLEVDLQEGSIVTFPANPDAQIDAIKQKLLVGDLPTIREFEEILREKGFSRKQAEMIAACGFKSLLNPGEPDRGEISPVAAALAALRSSD